MSKNHVMDKSKVNPKQESMIRWVQLVRCIGMHTYHTQIKRDTRSSTAGGDWLH